ncbi:MAG: alpha-glucosidase/alpha-galactosidase [Terrimicrobiaceae bacterium]
MNPKISLIGAGSVVFAKNLIGDILQSPELGDATICLMDIDPARLKVAEVMANKMVAKLKSRVRIQATLSQKEACRNAGYVICTIQVGGYKPGTVIDFEIPRKFGLLQTIGDTLGVGGVFRALRTIPVINSIAEDIAVVGAEGCLLLNYTNPMSMNCMAVAKAVGIPHVGLCHSVQGTSQQLAGFAGLPYQDITYLVAGINHMAFFLRFDYRGQDAYPLLFKLLEDPGFQQEKVRFEMMRRTGYFVTESSEHQSEYVPYFIHHGKPVIDRFEVPIDEYLRRCEAIIKSWKQAESELLGKGGDIQINPPSHEYGAYIIKARETDRPTVVYGNVPNTGLITNLPDGCCVEVPCLVDAQGIQPTFVGDLPPQLAALCLTNINVQTLAVEAALTGKREHIYHAVMLDPHTSSVLPLDKIWAMCDEMIAAHQKAGLLGEYAPVVKGTGRAHAGTGDRILATVEFAAKAEKTKRAMAVTVAASNPGPKPVTVPLSLGSEPEGVLAADRKMKFSVPAGKTVRRDVLLRRCGEDREFTLVLRSGMDGVLARSLFVPVRRNLDVSGGPTRFEVELNGFPAVNGTLSCERGRLRLAARVQDSKITTQAEQFWAGSCVEMFFARESGGAIHQIFVVPGEGKKKPFAADSRMRTVPGVKLRQTVAGSHYDLEAILPLEAVGLTAGEPAFLFDAIFNLSALGDAHSGGRAPLGGRLNSSTSSTHFARVEC